MSEVCSDCEICNSKSCVEKIPSFSITKRDRDANIRTRQAPGEVVKEYIKNANQELKAQKLERKKEIIDK